MSTLTTTGIPESGQTHPHEHAWVSESHHRTSDGWVIYVRCTCGSRRVDHQAYPNQPPIALSVATSAHFAD